MAILGLDKAREAEVSKKCTVIVGSVLTAMALFWAAMKPPQFVWADGRAVGGVAGAVFLYFNTVGFFVCLGIVWFLLQGFPMEAFVGFVLVLWSGLYVACLFSITDVVSLGLSLIFPFAFLLFLIANRTKSEVQPLQEDATPSPV